MPNQKSKGQALVEFALVFPLLLILILGVIEFGRLIFAYATTIAASREAARYGAAIQNIGGGVPQYKDCDGIRAAAKRIGGITGVADNNIAIQYRDELGIYDTDCPPDQKVDLADQIVVTINSSFTPFPLLNLPTIPISSSSSRSIIKEVEVGENSTGAGSGGIGSPTVNFRATYQQTVETDGTVYVTIDLSEPVADPVSIPYSLTGTAQQGSDYSVLSGNPITIPAGDLETTIAISLTNDKLPEGGETLILGLETPTNADRGTQTIHSIAIEDPPKVYFETTAGTSSEGEGTVSLTVRIDKTPSRDITIPYNYSGTATWGSNKDYTTAPSEIKFPANADTLFRSLSLKINDDTVDESDETATLTLGTPSNAILGTNQTHAHTITDNDGAPTIAFQISSQTVSEGLILATSVVLSNPSEKNVSVEFSPIKISAEPADFSILTSSPLVFPPGETQVDILIEISENDGYDTSTDALVEKFELVLENPVHADLGTPSSQIITITEDANAPTVTFLTSGQTVSESDGLISIPVLMSNAYASEVRINYSLAGTAISGTGYDYTVSGSPLIISPGDTIGEIEVQVLEDDIHEGVSESIILNIDSVVNGLIGSTGSHTLTVTDNDNQPQVNFRDPSQTVNEQDGSAIIYAELSNPSTKQIVVSLIFGGSATPGEDYDHSSPAEIIFPALATSSSFSITLLDDSHYDNNETISLTMDSITNAEQGGQNQHTITITDNELPPCDVGTYLLTVGNSTITWEVVNDGQDIVFTDGTITWPEESIGKPRLKSITLSGKEVYSGNLTPGTLLFPESGETAEPFPSLSTQALYFEFGSILGSGNHEITANFRNPSSGGSCSVSTTYNNQY